MKASQFKQLIKEAVREALKEELSNVAPAIQERAQQSNVPSTGIATLDAMLNETKASMNNEDYRNVINMSSQDAQGFGIMKPQSSDPTHVGQALSTAPKVGLDISQLDFVKKASAVYNKAVEKSNNK
jgi:hypothetical protein